MSFGSGAFSLGSAVRPLMSDQELYQKIGQVLVDAGPASAR